MYTICSVIYIVLTSLSKSSYFVDVREWKVWRYCDQKKKKKSRKKRPANGTFNEDDWRYFENSRNGMRYRKTCREIRTGIQRRHVVHRGTTMKRYITRNERCIVLCVLWKLSYSFQMVYQTLFSKIYVIILIISAVSFLIVVGIFYTFFFLFCEGTKKKNVVFLRTDNRMTER